MNAPHNPAAQAGAVIDNDLPARALEGVRTRRMIAILFDLILVTVLVGVSIVALAILGVLTFGLTWLLIPAVIALYPLIALLYNGLTVSGWRRATPGMHMMDLEMRLTDGGTVSFLHAAVHAVLFYLTWYVFAPLILVSLVAHNKRCLHDMLANVVVVRKPN